MLVRGLRGRPPFNNVPELQSARWPMRPVPAVSAPTAVCATLPKTPRLSLQVFQRSEGPFFPLKKMPGRKKKKIQEKGEERVLYCGNLSVTDSCSESGPGWGSGGGGAGATGTDYLGSSITPLLRSVILGYFTFFWSSSF